MGCCCSCLSSCCCTEAGLRCHSVVTLCGTFFFFLIFALFDRQKHFFEFEMTDPEGIKWACLFSAILWLFLFLVVIYKLMSMDKQQAGPSKNKISLAQFKSLRNSQQFQVEKGEQQQFLREKKV